MDERGQTQDTFSADEIMTHLATQPRWQSASPAQKRAVAMRMMRLGGVPEDDMNKSMSGLMRIMPQGGFGPSGTEVADMAGFDPETTHAQRKWMDEKLPSASTVAAEVPLLALAGTGPVGRVVGGALGEVARQTFAGYPNYDWGEVGMAGATVAVPEGVMGAGRFLHKMGPTVGARSLNPIAQEHALKTVERYRPDEDPNALFRDVRQNYNTWRMDMPHMQQEIERSVGSTGVKGEFQRGSDYTQSSHSDAASHLSSIMRMLNGVPGRQGKGMRVNPSGYAGDIQAELNHLREKALNASGTELNAYSSALKAALNDLEKYAELERRGAFIDPTTGRPAQVGAQALLDARYAYLRNETVNDMKQMIEKAYNPISGSGSAERFNSAQVIRQLKQDPFFSKAFSEQEQAELRGMLDIMNKVPPLQPHGSINAGSKRIMTAAGFAAAGAGGGYASGSPLLMVTGAVLGAGIPQAYSAINNALVAWKMPAGKALLKQLAMGNTTPQVMADVLANYAGAATREASSRMFSQPTDQQLHGAYEQSNKDVASLPPGPGPTGAQSPTNGPYDAVIARAAQKYPNVPEHLIRSMIHTESGGRAGAVSPKGAQGLMQLMPETAKQYGVTDPHDPEQNIMAGTAYINDLLNRYGGDLNLALAAYNAGPGNVSKYRGMPPFKETQLYVPKVLDRYAEISGIH